MPVTAKTNLTVNPQRLWDTLMDTAKFGATPKGGIKRLTVSDEDKKVRDWFKAECPRLCKIATRLDAHPVVKKVAARNRT